MIVKRYYAEDMQEAMATIRAELGPDAVILSSKPVRKKGITGFFQKKELEVIAAYEPKLETPRVREERESAAYQAAIQAVQEAQGRIIPAQPSQPPQQTQQAQQPSHGYEMDLPPVSPGAPLGPIEGRSKAQAKPVLPGERGANGFQRTTQAQQGVPQQNGQPGAQTMQQAQKQGMQGQAGFPHQAAPGQAMPGQTAPGQAAQGFPQQVAQGKAVPGQAVPGQAQPQGKVPVAQQPMQGMKMGMDVPAGQSAAARAAAQYSQTAHYSQDAQTAQAPKAAQAGQTMPASFVAGPQEVPTNGVYPRKGGNLPVDNLPFEVEDLDQASVDVVLSKEKSESAAERSRGAFAAAGQASAQQNDDYYTAQGASPDSEEQRVRDFMASVQSKEYELADPHALANAIPIVSALTQEESSRLDALDQKLNALTNIIESFAKRYEFIRHDSDYKYDPEIEPYLMKMLDNDVEQELAHALARATQETFRTGQAPRQAIEELLRGVIGPAAPLTFTEGRPVVLFMGPTGVGKTTTLVKLATMCSVRDRRKVGLINTDTYRIAAQEQLRTYAEILDVPLKVVYSPTDLSAAINDMRDREVIFVDTAGKRPGDPQHRADMLDLMAASGEDAIPLLAVSAPTSHRSMRELFEHYDFLDEYRVILTKTDETSGWGAAVNACHLSGMPIAYTTGGQSVPDDIEQAEANELIRRLLR